jgi:hypothetical protein
MKATKTPASRKKQPDKEWTIMVYMAGDNNLSEEMITGLKGMLANAGKAKINLIAVYDSCRPTVPIKIYDFSKKLGGAQSLNRYSVDPEIVAEIPYTTTEFVGIKHFARFILRQRKYRANRYALIIAGHSDGILGRSLVRDDEPQSVLDLKKLRRILDNARSFLPRAKKRFDLIGFDSCLMSMLEVEFEFREIADVIVGSEGNIPVSGWNYREIVESFPRNGKMTPNELATKIAEIYGDFNQDYEIGGRALDISACDLTQIEPFVNAVDKLARLLLDILKLPVGDSNSQSQAQKVNFIVKQFYLDAILLAHYASQSYLHNQAVDILDFVDNLLIQSARKYFEAVQIYKDDKSKKGKVAYAKLAPSLPVEVATLFEAKFDELLAIREELNTAADPFILESKDVGPEYQYSRGVALFLPWTELALDMVYKRYRRLRFNSRPGLWLQFIEELTNLTLREGEPVPLFGVTLTKLSFTLGQMTFRQYVDFGHRQHSGRQHAGRQHSGRGEFEAFYKYFSEFRNYSTEVK